MNGPVEQALESRHGLTPHIESDDHGGLELDREGWLAEDDDPQGDGMVGERLDGSWMMSEHREPRRRQAEVQSWKTGCQFEPWLQRPHWVNKDACSALVENLGEHGGQEIPGRIQRKRHVLRIRSGRDWRRRRILIASFCCSLLQRFVFTTAFVFVVLNQGALAEARYST